jgi:hypothetical protein
VPQQPLVNEKAEKAEKHAHGGADDAATQTVDGVGKMVVVGAPDAVDDEFQHDGQDEYRNRDGIHVSPGRHHSAEACGIMTGWISGR